MQRRFSLPVFEVSYKHYNSCELIIKWGEVAIFILLSSNNNNIISDFPFISSLASLPFLFVVIEQQQQAFEKNQILYFQPGYSYNNIIIILINIIYVDQHYKHFRLVYPLLNCGKQLSKVLKCTLWYSFSSRIWFAGMIYQRVYLTTFDSSFPKFKTGNELSKGEFDHL